MKLKNIALQLFLAALTIVVSFAVCEFGLRLVHYVRDGRPLFAAVNDNPASRSPHWEDDPDLGWKAPGSQMATYKAKDITGRNRSVQYSTSPRGFRSYGDANSTNIKIMIVGDSFTQAIHVSDDETYYAMLKRNLSDQMPVEIFAYGIGGYGTLQEVMIVEKFIKEIHTDIFVLQTCWNDFVNNSYELEMRSYVNNNGHVRPYLEPDGTVTMRMPQPEFRISMLRVASYSRFVYWLTGKFDNWMAVNKQADSI